MIPDSKFNDTFSDYGTMKHTTRKKNTMEALRKYLDAQKDVRLEDEDDKYIYFYTDNMHHIFMLRAMGHTLSYQEKGNFYLVRIPKKEKTA